MSETKIDKAIATAGFIMKKRRRLVDEMSRRVDLNENQKIYIGNETELLQVMETLIKRVKENTNMHLGKLPPQDLTLESAVLGAILLETEPSQHFPKTPYDLVKGFLMPEHFYTEAHQETYKTVQTLASAGKSYDLISVCNELRRVGKMEIVGGATYLSNMVSKVSQSRLVEQHARVMIEMAIKRRLILMAGQVLSDGYDETTDCFELLDATEKTFTEIKSWIK